MGQQVLEGEELLRRLRSSSRVQSPGPRADPRVYPQDEVYLGSFTVPVPSRHGGKQGKSVRDTAENSALEAGGGAGRGRVSPDPPTRLSGWGTGRRESGSRVAACPRAAAPQGPSPPLPLRSRPSCPCPLWDSPTLRAFGHLSQQDPPWGAMTRMTHHRAELLGLPRGQMLPQCPAHGPRVLRASCPPTPALQGLLSG